MRGIERQLGRVYEEKGFYYLEKIYDDLDDLMLEENAKNGNPSFSWWGNIVLEYTELKEEELNKYSTDEIIAIANTIFEVANKKK